MDKYFVYILKSTVVNVTYVGHTNDLERRLGEHNHGKSRFTSKFKPWKVMYSEQLNSEKEAILREKFFKSTCGRRKIKELLSIENLPR